jgi:hypothetical protein
MSDTYRLTIELPLLTSLIFPPPTMKRFCDPAAGRPGAIASGIARGNYQQPDLRERGVSLPVRPGDF